MNNWCNNTKMEMTLHNNNSNNDVLLVFNNKISNSKITNNYLKMLMIYSWSNNIISYNRNCKTKSIKCSMSLYNIRRKIYLINNLITLLNRT